MCLAAFASYMTAFTAKFAVGGFDLLKSFGLVGNGTVAVLILSSLTQSGQQVLAKLLTRLKVPPKYYSEVSFGASLLLLLSAMGVQASLPHIGQFYYTQGETNFYRSQIHLGRKAIAAIPGAKARSWGYPCAAGANLRDSGGFGRGKGGIKSGLTKQ